MKTPPLDEDASGGSRRRPRTSIKPVWSRDIRPKRAWQGRKGQRGRIIPPRNRCEKAAQGPPFVVSRGRLSVAGQKIRRVPVQLFDQVAQPRLETPPAGDGAAPDRLAHLREAQRRDAPLRRLRREAGIVPWQPGKGDQAPGSPARVPRSGPRNRGYAPAPADARPRTPPAPHADGCSGPCAPGRRRSGAAPRETCSATATGPCPAGRAATRRIARRAAPRRHGPCAKTSRSPCRRRPGRPRRAAVPPPGSARPPRRSAAGPQYPAAGPPTPGPERATDTASRPPP
jgi:hypothetical protein